MPRGVVASHAITRAGTPLAVETVGDATNNHTVANDGNVFILAHNTGVGARTVTFLIKGTVDGVAPTAAPHSLAAAATQLFGPFPTDSYGEDLDINVEHAEMKLAAYAFVGAS